MSAWVWVESALVQGLLWLWKQAMAWLWAWTSRLMLRQYKRLKQFDLWTTLSLRYRRRSLQPLILITSNGISSQLNLLFMNLFFY
jgi:hypothetical protein